MNLQRVQSIFAPQAGSGHAVPGGVTGNRERPLFRLNLWRALQLHRRLAFGIAVGGFLIAVAYVIKAWPVYTAQSQLYVQAIQSKVMAGPDQSFTSNSAAYDSFVQQQVQSASNPDVLLAALQKLKPGSWQRSGETEQAAVVRLGRAIEVARQGTSYEVAIVARARDPHVAAQIANAVATSVVERASGEGNAGNDQRIAVLREEHDRIQSALTADYIEQNSLNKQLGMAAVGTEAPDLIDADIGKTREELIKAQTDHDQAAARFVAMGAGNGDSSAAIDAEADDMIAADAGLTSMKTSLNSRRAVLITHMSNLTPSNPEYKQDAAELAKINGSLDTMMKDLRAKAAARIQQKLRMDLERTAGVETRLNGQLRQLAGTAASATPKLQRASDLATDIARLRARYTNVDEQLHNLMLESSAPGAVHMSVAAVPPLHPTVSGILKKALPIIFGGLLFGLLAASVANHLDPKVYIGADIEQVLGFAPMAVLPDFDEVTGEVSAEHLLRLSAAIEHARKQGDLSNCIFTGTSSGVGVTTLANRVCDVLAAMGRPTVLLDSSRTPQLATRANSMEDASDAFATQRGSRSTALLRRVAAESELEEESFVLTDTAPLLVSAETEYLARFVDCAIVVAESGVTTRSQLLAAVNTLQRLDVAAMGFVLNSVKLGTSDPEFRRSVREIEKHHRAQNSSSSRRANPKHVKRTVSVADEFLPDPKELASESSVKGNASASEPGSGTVAHRSSAVVAQWSKAAPVKPWLPQTPHPLGKTSSEQTDSESLWWLSDADSKAPAQPEPVEKVEPLVAVPPVSTASQAEDPREGSISKDTWETAASRFVEFKRQRRAESGRTGRVVSSPLTAEEIASSGPIGPATNSKPTPVVAESVAAVEADRVVPIAFRRVAAPAVAETDSQARVVGAGEETPTVVSPRLNALRGLVFSIGLKNLNKSREAHLSEAESPAAAVDDPKREVVSRSFTPFAESDAVSAAPAAAQSVAPTESSQPAVPTPNASRPTEVPPAELAESKERGKEMTSGVTAVPEILPPREFVPVREDGDGLAISAGSRSNRREAWDEVQILPSRRGQYKRRT